MESVVEEISAILRVEMLFLVVNIISGSVNFSYFVCTTRVCFENSLVAMENVKICEGQSEARDN